MKTSDVFFRCLWGTAIFSWGLALGMQRWHWPLLVIGFLYVFIVAGWLGSFIAEHRRAK